MSKILSGLLGLLALSTGRAQLFTNPPPSLSYEPVAQWHWRNPLPQGNSLEAVAYGGSRFVAVGAAGTIVTSPDGTNWCAVGSGTGHWLNAITFGDGTYVAVGREGTILTSTNGVAWTTRAAPADANLSAVTYGNGIYVAIGKATIFYSTNGSVWASATAPTTGTVYAIAFGGGAFVAVSSETAPTSPSLILTSPDGMHWTRRDPGANLPIQALAYGAGKFVAVGDGDTVLTSSDGGVWTAASLGTNVGLTHITYGDAGFLANGGDGYMVSPDGLHWTISALENSETGNFLNIAYGNHTFVGIGTFGNNIVTSSDGREWIPRYSPGFNDLTSIASGNGILLVMGEGRMFISSNGVEWTQRLITNGNSTVLTYGDGKFLGVGAGGSLSISVDGTSWISNRLAGNFDLTDVVYGNGLYLAAGQSNGTTVRLVSADGEHWSETTYTNQGYSLAFANEKFFALGFDSISTSVDGQHWTTRATGRTNGLYDLVSGIACGNGLYMAVGTWFETEDDYFTLVLTSRDGMNWTRFLADVLDCGYLQRITFAEGYFVAVGEDGISISSDGADWARAYPEVQGSLRDVLYWNGTFVAVGENSAILQTDPLVRLRLEFGRAASLLISGPTNRSCRIEAADALMTTTSWHELATFLLETNPFSWTDVQSTNFATRFYRAALLP